MAHNPFIHILRQLMRDYRISQQTGCPVDEVYEQRVERKEASRRNGGMTRRNFLIGAGAAAAATAIPYGLARAKGGGGGGTTNVPIAIIGGGMAGLAAALRLKDAGVTATIFESQLRVGGRLLTDRSKNPKTTCGLCHNPRSGGDTGWAEDQYVDVFGELIDSLPRWKYTWGLAGRYWSVDPNDPDCVMVDMFKDYPAGATDTYYFDNKYYPWSQVLKDFKPVYDAVVRDERSAPYPTTYKTAEDRYATARRTLDNMSIYEWIETRVPGGHDSPMGKLLDAEYNIEYGMETTQQSAFNLIYLLAYQPDRNSFSVYGESDEKWKLKGGIDRLTTAMAEEIGWDNIRMQWALRRITRASDGSYYLDFNGGQRVRATYVLFALPFSALRASVDFSNASFSEFKVRTIRKSSVGHNGKMGLQFTRRFWNEQGPWGISNGNIASDNGCQYGWDATRGVPGTSGILIKYTGGNVCDADFLAHPLGNQYDRNAVKDAQVFLGQLESLFPGISLHWNGKVVASKAHLDPNYLCGYGNYLPGGYTQFCGFERVPEGNVFFAGEHTSIDFFGFFEGAAEEGWTSADGILRNRGLAFAPSMVGKVAAV